MTHYKGHENKASFSIMEDRNNDVMVQLYLEKPAVLYK